MARAVDLLRATWPDFKPKDLDSFLGWVDGQLMPQMDHYVDVITPQAIAKGRRNTYGNWHASVADCMMAVGVLSDDRARYDKGLALYRKTVKEYFRWGRGEWAAGRTPGESTETLRDIYHTLFGIGSLIQAAETAWAQNDDVYSESGHALAAALELHARIINAHAAKDEAALPPGFKFFGSMPPPPRGCSWKWDFETQLWSSYAHNRTKCSDLRDGFKYAVGVTFLPTGFELGYNHFVGRLGMKLPETAALLEEHPVDWFAFSWGLATLTHANTAKELWRAGLARSTLCGPRRPELARPLITVSPPALTVGPYGRVSATAPRVVAAEPAGSGLALGGVSASDVAQQGADTGVLSFGLPSPHLDTGARSRGGRRRPRPGQE
jgi:hypothetical protein